jgi:hypothetical protein
MHQHCHAGASNCHHPRPQQQQQQQGVASMMAGHTAAAVAGSYCASREWLYRLVTFPAYFTPCIHCCSGCRTPKREQLMTLFDTKFPHKVFCSHCPESQVNGGAAFLQVRRASFKDVVKATDIARFGADVSGVQQYTLNGSKVIYLNREAALEKKPNNNGSTAPAMCTVDGRAMMDKSSLYCSLKCKMQAEDAGFTCWLDAQDPAVRIMADIAANAPPRPTVACKRGVAPTSSGSSGGSAATESNGGSSAGRPKKQARTESGGNVGAAAGAPAGQGTGDESAAPAAAAAARVAKQRASAAMQRAASAPQGAPAGLKPIKTGLPGGGIRMKMQPKVQQHQQALLLPSSMLSNGSAGMSRQSSAPSAFLEAAMAEPQLAGGFSSAAAAAAPRLLQVGGGAANGISCSSWLAAPTDLDNALSSNVGMGSWEAWGSWQGGLPASPSFALDVHGVQDTWEDGSLSPALMPAAPAAAAEAAGSADFAEPAAAAAAVAGCFGGLGGGMDDWWMPGSPAGVFATAGMAGF